MFFRKYRLYKRLLQGFLFINTLFMMVGAIAGYRYFQTNHWSDGQIFFLGLGTFAFGIILPLILIKKIETQMREWEIKTQKMISEWVASWVAAQNSSDDDFYRDPLFWLNFFLIGVESMQGQFKNPFFHFVSEMSPMIRQSIEHRKQFSRKKSRPHKATG